MSSSHDVRQNFDLHSSVIETKNADMMVLIAFTAARAGDAASYRAWLARAEDLDHPTTLHHSAALTERAGDSDGGWRLMQQAIAAGAIPALTRIGRLASLRHNDRLSRDLLLRSAKLGDSEAMYDVANDATERGKHSLALRWYTNAVHCEAGTDWPIKRGVGYYLL